MLKYCVITGSRLYIISNLKQHKSIKKMKVLRERGGGGVSGHDDVIFCPERGGGGLSRDDGR